MREDGRHVSVLSIRGRRVVRWPPPLVMLFTIFDTGLNFALEIKVTWYSTLLWRSIKFVGRRNYLLSSLRFRLVILGV